MDLQPRLIDVVIDRFKPATNCREYFKILEYPYFRKPQTGLNYFPHDTNDSYYYHHAQVHRHYCKRFFPVTSLYQIMMRASCAHA